MDNYFLTNSKFYKYFLVILFLTIFDIYQNKPTRALKTWQVQAPKIPPHVEITRFDGTYLSESRYRYLSESLLIYCILFLGCNCEGACACKVCTSTYLCICRQVDTVHIKYNNSGLLSGLFSLLEIPSMQVQVPVPDLFETLQGSCFGFRFIGKF